MIQGGCALLRHGERHARRDVAMHGRQIQTLRSVDRPAPHARSAAAKAEAKKHAKPVSPFATFVSENFARKRATMPPGTKTTEVVTQLGAEWRKIPQDKKDALLEQYKDGMAAWKAKQEVA